MHINKWILKLIQALLFGLILLISGILGIILGTVSLCDYSPNMLLEKVFGETPQTKINEYLKAIVSENKTAALDVWKLPGQNSNLFQELSERRELVTDELLSQKITGFTIYEPQWWSTCCGQGVTQLARNAGGARVEVHVFDSAGKSQVYIFDVFVDGVYFGEAAGNPYRHWFLRDVYSSSELPIYWQSLYTGMVHFP